MDDIIIMGPDPVQLKRDKEEIIGFLQWLGWTVSMEKSMIEPRQVFEYLGLVWDTRERTVVLV